MKRLLIIGASILQLPAIQKAKELGMYVGVIDYNPNAIGIPYADEYFNVSTIDEDGVYKAAKAFGAEGIMTLATDMPMRSVAYACSKLGLTGISYETAVKATDKGEMIKAFANNGVEHPWYYILPVGDDAADVVGNVIDNITYPCITKPTDNSGSRGVMLVQNREELEAALAYSRQNGRTGNVIVEEYLVGPEVSVEIMTLDGTPHIIQITDKLTTGAPHFVEMGHSQPSNLSKEDLEKIADLASRAVKAVGITNGPAHVEIMLTKDGPKMVELGARMGGDCITTHLVPLSTGVDMIQATIEVCLGQTPDIAPKWSKGSAIRFFDVPAGILTGISGVEEAEKLQNVKEISFTKGAGDIVDGIGSSTDRVGFAIAQADTATAAIAACEAALHTVKFTVTGSEA